MVARRKTGIQKLVIAGLGLAFLGIIVGSVSDYTFVAGIIFVAVVILGIVGIMKMQRSK
ncbi:MAG: hypothetical protein ACE5KA_07460 [Nitrososphaerales archaeon]